MNVTKVTPGKNAPQEVNVIIEISANAGPIKYEFDKDISGIVVDRIMPTSFSYPCNYGFIPGTLSGDNDPIDVLVYSSAPIIPGAMIRVRPIGVLMTEDEGGKDEKILAVPLPKVDPIYANITSYKQLPEIAVKRIEHFFENYKGLEPGKWVKVSSWQDHDVACELISKAIENYSLGL